MTKKNAHINKQANAFANLGNTLIVLLLKGVARLPFAVIYALSNFLYLLNKYVLKYRYQICTENLKYAFPEKKIHEINAIRDKFYRHFFDFSLESVKLYAMSAKQMARRVVLKGFPEFESITGKRKGAILLAYHYNNWEWSSYCQTQFKYPILKVYNPPRNNKPMEYFLKHSRGKWGGEVIPTGNAARSILEYKQKGQTAVFWLAADQTALANSPFWMRFLNREAAFFTGPEKIAAKTNFPVFFQHIKKLARGKYQVEISLLADEPAKMEANEILRRYVRKMEEAIKDKPEYYLWSHRRWKHTRPKNTRLIK